MTQPSGRPFSFDEPPPVDDTDAPLEAPWQPVTTLHPHAIEEVSTDALVDRARGGDREAYGMLFGRFHDEIYRFATRRLGDPVAGQDAAAETFADAFGSIHRFQWRGFRFEAWLYTIARRRIADQLRSKSRSDRHRGSMDEPITPDRSKDVLDAIEVRDLIARLPESERDVIELRFMEDLDVEQTAARLDRTPGAIRVAQHRALNKLRRLLAEGTA